MPILDAVPTYCEGLRPCLLCLGIQQTFTILAQAFPSMFAMCSSLIIFWHFDLFDLFHLARCGIPATWPGEYRLRLFVARPSLTLRDSGIGRAIEAFGPCRRGGSQIEVSVEKFIGGKKLRAFLYVVILFLVYLFIYLFFCLFIYLCVYLSICFFVYFFVYLFICLFIYLFIYFFIHLFIHFFIHSFIYSFISISISLHIYIDIYLFNAPSCALQAVWLAWQLVRLSVRTDRIQKVSVKRKNQGGRECKW